MKMTFRWYGKESDPIPLRRVRQIPGMSGLMGLPDMPAGADWPEREVRELVDYDDTCPESYIRPDHGRMIRDEEARRGCGLYDRALGATHLNGIWEALCRMKGDSKEAEV